MTDKTYTALMDAANDIGLLAGSINDYSGRGMFGKTTYAIVLRGWHHLAAMAAHAACQMSAEESEAFVTSLSRLVSDDMGRDNIVIY